MTTITNRPPGGLPRKAWKAAHEPVAGVPRWARIAAYAIPLVVLPSSIWRILAVAFHVPLMDMSAAGSDTNGSLPGWFTIELYVVLLSLASETLAFSAIGLVARWGEVFPRWMPRLGGRRVPVMAAVIPAALGSVALTLLWTWATVMAMLGRTLQGESSSGYPFAEYDWQFVVASAAYVPLIAWGPLLAAVTIAYYRRRNASR